MRKLELWGGHECTINRVGDVFHDQSVRSGHTERDSDLDLFASLGLDALRYPVLWERVSPGHCDNFDWTWCTRQLSRLRALHIRPIVGLVHHGSGPRYTNLLADNFASGLERFAAAVAARFDWVEDWTPVNEPLTTARFSALYGTWYPHKRDERSFWAALLNQIDATRLAMRAIRRVVPTAHLIQTEDLGRTWATRLLSDQAGFDNTRRWMTWDLLTGAVTPEHALWSRITGFGLGDRLRAIADEPCPPDIIGVNHYLTSDRFLDHRFREYPSHAAGGNDRQRFADVEAIRVLDPPAAGFEGALREAWQRYGIPVAATEVHNGSTRDEQMRWFDEAWQTSRRLRGEGVEIHAVTSWALLGSHGWNTLLTSAGRYEAGAFDVSSGTPRATGMTRLLQAPKSSRHFATSASSGWWRQPTRLLHAPAVRPATIQERKRAIGMHNEAAAPLLVAGATGTLGRALAAACRHRNLRYVLTDRAKLELTDAGSIDRALDRHRPWAVLNATGWVRVDDAEDDPDGCFRANTHAAMMLAKACADRETPSVTFSSDLVFDGRSEAPYHESDPPCPLNIYGCSKAAAEAAIQGLAGSPLIIRTAAFFSPNDPYNFASVALSAFDRGERFAAAADQIVSPTYVPHLCNAVLDLLIDGEDGIWHLTNGTPISWADFAVRIANFCGFNPDLVDPRSGAELGFRAPRPRDSALKSSRGRLMPTLDEGLAEFATSAHYATAQL